jgi:hypothetical protein
VSEILSGASRGASGAAAGTSVRPRTPGRPQDWPERLGTLLAAIRHVPFAWATHDCATIVCDWVLEMRGIDPMATDRTAYATEDEFEALVAPFGGLGDFVANRAAAAGIEECPPPFAQRGDVALVRLGNQECLGLVDGRHVAVPTLAGLRLAPRAAIARAWAV